MSWLQWNKYGSKQTNRLDFVFFSGIIERKLLKIGFTSTRQRRNDGELQKYGKHFRKPKKKINEDSICHRVINRFLPDWIWHFLKEIYLTKKPLINQSRVYDWFNTFRPEFLSNAINWLNWFNYFGAQHKNSTQLIVSFLHLNRFIEFHKFHIIKVYQSKSCTKNKKIEMHRCRVQLHLHFTWQKECSFRLFAH